MYSYSKPNNIWKYIAIIILTAIITFYLTKFMPNLVSAQDNSVQRLSYSNDLPPSNLDIDTSLPNIIDNAMQSIVGISVLEPSNDKILDPNVTEKWGIGTGIIVSSRGYILTNQHLATKINSRINVTLDNGKAVQGKVIWNEPNIDLAIVKIDEKNLQSISLGDSDKLKVGEEVLAIGNPLGLEFQRSATKGIISGLNRTLKIEDNISSVVMEDLIQTDASINSGNSGGPLINLDGEVIGINTVKINSAEGIGFAVPINIVKPIIEKLETEDKFDEAYLGLYGYDKEIIPYVNSKIKNVEGIYVAELTKNGPAEKFGVKVGDVIISIDNIEVNKMMDLRKHLYSKEPGEIIKLKVIRDDEEKNINVTLTRKT